MSENSSNRKKTVANKRTASKSTRSTGKKSQTTKRKQDKRTIDKQKRFIRSEIIVIAAAFLGLFLFLCNFNILGVAGDYVSSFEKGLLGNAAYAFPVLMLISVGIYIKEKGNFLAKLKLISCITIILILSALMQLLFGGEELLPFLDYYKEGANGALGGGLIGGVIAGVLRGLTGTVGAYLILIALFIACMVVVTEKSFISAAKHGAEKTADIAKEQHERYREAQEENRIRRRMKKEEERLSRIEKDYPFIDLQKIQSEDEDGKQHIDEEELSRAIAEQAKLYAEFGRDIIGVEGVDLNIIQDENKTQTQEYDPSFETTVFTRADEFTGTINTAESYDYDIDEVPFEVNDDDRYKSFDKLNTAEKVISLDTAVKSGFADYTDVSSRAVEDISIKAEETEIKRLIEEEEDDYSDCDINNKPDVDDHLIYQTSQGKDMESPSSYEADKILREKKASIKQNEDTVLVSSASLGVKADTKEDKKVSEQQNAAVAKDINEKKNKLQPYIFPPTRLLTKGSGNTNVNQDELKETAIKLQRVLHTFGVGVTVTNVTRGPSVTRYEMAPDIGVKVSKITSLADDIKLALAASDIRIEAPIPGKSAVGIEVPNKKNSMVHFRDIIETDEFRNAKSRLSFGIGKDIQGQVIIGNIAKMPHVLIAGATGSGKSVGINTLIMSIIYKAKPEEVRMIMIDPKVVELSVYNGIPHLLIPVVTDAKKAVSALNWAVAEMNDRYRKFAETGTRNLSGYNEKIEQISQKIPEDERPAKLPQIVIIIDELAELMMTASKEVEADIVRLAQLARAAGMHLVIATQRPSVDVITGLIKANIPSRIAFKTSSGVDSRTILDMVGAETLLGNGDMLYYPADAKKPLRIQGAFVSDEEVENVVAFLTKNGNTGYEEEITRAIDEQKFIGSDGTLSSALDERDEYFEAAGMLITEKGKASIGMLQRMFKIGFNRAARIMDQLYEAGVVGEDEGTKPRKVILSLEEFKEMCNQK
ncbi:MAG: DNA translocase FtsK 4TM domain-containing protein [Eubacteriales bacterium]|nr:DNA translocase FtsK 4TM domain-containing protein [Eubacteriales bacterium]